ncbi:hypothetical protein ACFOWE_28675 [Planomonospora corallina]|uniref:Uncharacterized protein n=1 Tax=Planomonospora corallina TaxID=1806052 RepID=A0ABV8IDI0_9ACTN
MGPELHLQMMTSRHDEFIAEATEYRLARAAEAVRKIRSGGERRRALRLFGKTVSA